MPSFNADEHEPLGSYEPLPAGRYLAHAVDSAWKPTKNGRGHYLEIKWEVLDAEYRGRNLWSRMNLENDNETAVQIARKELTSILLATGVRTLRDYYMGAPETHHRQAVLVVRAEKRADSDDVVNEVRGYEAPESRTAPPVSRPAAASTGVPWRK